jgi:hypothetical protein
VCDRRVSLVTRLRRHRLKNKKDLIDERKIYSRRLEEEKFRRRRRRFLLAISPSAHIFVPRSTKNEIVIDERESNPQSSPSSVT